MSTHLSKTQDQLKRSLCDGNQNINYLDGGEGGGVQEGRVLTMEEQGNSEIPTVFLTLSRETAIGVHVSFKFLSHVTLKI